MKVKVKEGEGGLYFNIGDVLEVSKESDGFYALVGLEGKRFYTYRFEVLPEAPAFQVGWVYNQRHDGKPRRVKEIRDGRMYVQEWAGRWVGGSGGYRSAEGRWVGSSGSDFDERFDLLLETGRPDTQKVTIEDVVAQPCAFRVGGVYKTGGGDFRKVLEIDPKKGIRTAEWMDDGRGKRWVEPGPESFFRGLDGKRLAGKLASALVYGEVDDPAEPKLYGRSADRIVMDELAVHAEDPSARRDREHVPQPRVDPRTPFNHFPDLSDWTVKKGCDRAGNSKLYGAQGWWSRG